jgi:flagellar motor switch protein FliG
MNTIGLKCLECRSLDAIALATILVHLDPEQASDVLECFTERTRNDVLLRIATLDGIQPAALRELDDVMTELLSGSGNVKRKAVGGVRAAAEILNYLSTQHEESVIDNVRSYDDDLAQRIIDEMFTFENLVELDDRAIRLLLREVGTETLGIALKVGPPELRQKFMANMSQRAAELFSEDMDTRGPVRLSEVEAQQRKVMQVARDLAGSGEIALGDKADDMYV